MANQIQQTLQADAFRYNGKTGGKAMMSAFLHYPGFRFTFFLRKVRYYSSRKRSIGLFPYIVYRIFLNHYTFKYGFDISPTGNIGPGLYLGHFGGIVVSPYAVLGNNINLTKGAVIGATSRGPKLGAPTLEDRVWVGSNAVIVGKITIGREALIAPNAYVNFDVPSKAVVLGNPGKIVAQTGSEGYVNNTLS